MAHRQGNGWCADPLSQPCSCISVIISCRERGPCNFAPGPHLKHRCLLLHPAVLTLPPPSCQSQSPVGQASQLPLCEPMDQVLPLLVLTPCTFSPTSIAHMVVSHHQLLTSLSSACRHGSNPSPRAASLGTSAMPQRAAPCAAAAAETAEDAAAAAGYTGQVNPGLYLKSAEVLHPMPPVSKLGCLRLCKSTTGIAHSAV